MLIDDAVLSIRAVQRTQAVVKRASDPGPLLAVHIAASLMTVLCYPVLAVLGTLAVKSRPSLLPWHRRLGKAFLAFKAVNYATSWMV